MPIESQRGWYGCRHERALLNEHTTPSHLPVTKTVYAMLQQRCVHVVCPFSFHGATRAHFTDEDTDTGMGTQASNPISISESNSSESEDLGGSYAETCSLNSPRNGPLGSASRQCDGQKDEEHALDDDSDDLLASTYDDTSPPPSPPCRELGHRRSTPGIDSDASIENATRCTPKRVAFSAATSPPPPSRRRLHTQVTCHGLRVQCTPVRMSLLCVCASRRSRVVRSALAVGREQRRPSYERARCTGSQC